MVTPQFFYRRPHERKEICNFRKLKGEAARDCTQKTNSVQKSVKQKCNMYSGVGLGAETANSVKFEWEKFHVYRC